MIKIREAIVVEGRYDKIKLSSIIDAPILETSGFGIFQDKEKIDYLRAIAEKRGLIVFTDSDGAGFVIRNHIKSCIPKEYLKHAYIPDIIGKEKRKAKPGKEGKLGVEGMTPDIIISALKASGATIDGGPQISEESVTKQDFFDLGYSGRPDSSNKRMLLIKKLNLPQHMSSNALLEAVNLLYDLEAFKEITKQLENHNG